jgi:ankyrin repeat protein
VARTASLMDLMRAIVADDAATVSRLLMASPDLASAVLTAGATRQGANDYWLEEIGHYVYKDDTALHVAAAAYQHKIARKLIDAGANVRARNRRGAEPLHYAADGGPGSPSWNPEAQAATIAVLIAAGADPDATDNSGVAPLHRAVRTRCTGAVLALLNGGADIRRKNKSGSTPFRLATLTTGRGGSGSAEAKAQQVEIVRLLKEHGAR